MSGNPVLMVLEGNGSLQGRDRAGIFSGTGFGALRYAAAPGARVNYARNPGLLNNSTDWAAAGTGALTRTADAQFESDWCAELVADLTSEGANITVPMRGVASSNVTLTIGVNADLVSGASDWDVRAQAIDAAGSVLGSAGTAVDFTPSATYGRSVLTLTTPTTANAEGVQVQFRRKAATTSTLRIGDLTVEVGSTAGTWFTPVWLFPLTGQLGSAHAAPSVSRATFWVEEGTSNLFPNPGAEVDTTLAAVTAGLTLSRSTALALIGVGSFKVDHDGAHTKRLIVETASSLGYTGSARTFISSVWLRGTGNILIDLAVTYADATSTTTSTVLLTLTETWQRLVTPTLTIDPLKTVNRFTLSVRLNGAQAAGTFYADAAQLEEKTYATSYCDGSLGSGYSWAGTTHNSVSTRTQSYVETVAANHALPSAGAAIVRFALPRLSSASSRIVGISNWVAASGDAYLHYVSSIGAQNLGSASGGVQNPILSAPFTPNLGANQWTKNNIAWTATEIQGARNSGAVSAITRTQAIVGSFLTDRIRLGDFTSEYEGFIGPVAIYDAPLSDARRALVNAAIDSNGAIDLWGLFEGFGHNPGRSIDGRLYHPPAAYGIWR